MAARAEPIAVPWTRGRFASWLVTTDHKRIGILYIATTLLFFIAGGVMALLIRTQLATPNESFITRDHYNELFTIHGTTMVFLVVVPCIVKSWLYESPVMNVSSGVASCVRISSALTPPATKKSRVDAM